MITLEEAQSNAEKARRENLKSLREWRRKRLFEWRRKQALPSVIRFGLGKYPSVRFEKCPYCKSDVKSVYPPDPAIQPQNRKKISRWGIKYVPCIYIYECLLCGKKSADYHRGSYVSEEILRMRKDKNSQ